MDYFFSVVIPAFNRGELIVDTLESVFSQDTDSSYEVLVVDDGSTDNTREVIKALQRPNLRYLYQDNSGANKARNKGIENAKGKYVAMLDADDKFMPHHLSNAKKVLDHNPDMIVYSQVIADRGNGRTVIKPARAISESENMAEYLMCNKGFVPTPTLVLKTSFAREVQYLEGLKNGQDLDFAIRLFNKGYQFYMHPNPSVVVRDVFDRQRISNSSSAENRERWLEWIKTDIPSRAYYGYRGWFLAKSYAENGFFLRGLGLFATSFIKRSYSFKNSLIIFLQILLGKNYRTLADFSIKIIKPIS